MANPAQHTVRVAGAVSPSRIAADQLGYFRFGQLDTDRHVLTNEFGEWHVLDRASFRDLVEGRLADDHPDREALSAKGFLRSGLDPQHVAQAMRRRKRFVGLGPARHVVPLAQGDRRLSVETAKDVLDFVMLSTSSALELRVESAGAPVDLDQLGFLVQYTTEKNRYEGKAIAWKLVVDPATLDDATAAWLADKRFEVRAPVAGSLSAATAEGIGRVLAAAAAKRREASVAVEIEVSQATVGGLVALAPKLRELGVPRVRVVPALTGDAAIEPAAFAAAYGAFLDALLAQGGPVEELAALFACRIQRTDPPTDVAHRSPTTSGSGTVAYDVDGTIYPCEIARTLDDPSMFALGKAGVTAYKDATRHPTLRAVAVAGLLECLPGFADHWATPYLGVDPLLAFADTGDLFAKAPTSREFAVLAAAVRAVFDRLAAADEAGRAAAERLTAWIEK